MHTHTVSDASLSTPLGAAVGLQAQAQSRAAEAISEWLTFKLGTEEYGIDILRVQEIRSYEAPTRIANAPAMLKGVVNLRGVIVPIVDMRIHFGLPEPSYDALTVVIVLTLGKQVVGMVIDAVSDVITLAADEIKAAPHLAADAHTHDLLGIGSIGERTLMLLDIQQLICGEGLGLFAPALQ
jgi:purine-binding chemotaxis protein CheW